MKRFTPDTVDVDTIVDELLNHAGAVLFSGLFTAGQIAEARSIIMEHSNADAPKVTHFQSCLPRVKCFPTWLPTLC
jgi:hypothetical protein